MLMRSESGLACWPNARRVMNKCRHRAFFWYFFKLFFLIPTLPLLYCVRNKKKYVVLLQSSPLCGCGWDDIKYFGRCFERDEKKTKKTLEGRVVQVSRFLIYSGRARPGVSVDFSPLFFYLFSL